jgi:hypothetical protein
MTTININITNNIDKRVINKTYRNYKGKRQRLYGKQWINMCPHDKHRSQCVECGGTSICIHKKQRSRCVECGGTSICMHKKRRSQCVECGGTSICIHKKQRSICVECGGTSICIHKKQRADCKICDPDGHLYKIVSSRINSALGPGYNTIELLDINIQEYRVYLTKLFKEGMTWENYGDWEIDHIIPFGVKHESTIEQKIERFHYTNTQPLWKIENRRKSKRHKITEDSQTILKYIVKP